MSLLDRLAAKGAAFTPAPRSRAGAVFRDQGVADSREFRRVIHLPRRTVEITPEHAEALSAALRASGGGMSLRPVQAAALEELHACGGLVGAIRVGGGKTLISLLAGTVSGAARPCLVVPANLREKTRREFRALLAHWDVDALPEIVSYELLGRERGAKMLDELAPDLLVLDEAHMVKNPKAAVTRRVRRYLDEHPTCRVVVMSGTLTTRSLRDCAHLFDWALAERSPLPRSFPIVTEWGLAIDEELPPTSMRLNPGALRQLYGVEEARESAAGGDEVPIARRAVQRRIKETPGVIVSLDGGCSASLEIRLVPLDTYTPATDAAFDVLKTRWETPDGHPIADAVTKWRHACELASGFYYRWNPRPPHDWLEARRAWSATVRHILDHNRRELDSELQVARAVAAGEFDRVTIHSNGLQVGRETVRATFDAWHEIRPTFDPKTEAVWLDEAVVDFVRAWADEAPGIVWVGQVALGERLRDACGLPYFAEQGLDTRKRLIDTASPREGSIVASIASNHKGRNLQAWDRNLVIAGSLPGSTWQQMIGRTHRDGQKADVVTFDVLVGCVEQYAGFSKALGQCEYAFAVTGEEQKILIGDRIDPFVGGMPSGSPRWQ